MSCTRARHHWLTHKRALPGSICWEPHWGKCMAIFGARDAATMSRPHERLRASCQPSTS